MSASIPTIEPQTLRSGDTWKWRREDLADYPATTWTLKYRFKNASGGFEVVATADSAAFAITVTAAVTAGYRAGDYAFAAWVESGSEKYTVKTGFVTVLANLTAGAATEAFDARSTARKWLEAVEAVIGGVATNEHQELSYNGKQLKYKSMAELLRDRARLQTEVAREQDAERVAAGLQSRRRTFVRFGRA